MTVEDVQPARVPAMAMFNDMLSVLEQNNHQQGFDVPALQQRMQDSHAAVVAVLQGRMKVGIILTVCPDNNFWCADKDKNWQKVSELYKFFGDATFLRTFTTSPALLQVRVLFLLGTNRADSFT
jgi:hypothetical protein